jgi:thiamine pyrophosphokinase
MPSTHWYPTQIFNRNGTATPYSIIILNQPINTAALSAVLELAVYIVCADAGADRYLKFQRSQEHQQPQRNPAKEHNDARKFGTEVRDPHAIVGDLDSLSPATREWYESRGVKVVQDPDQYSTDFTKALKFIRQLVATSSSSASLHGKNDQPKAGNDDEHEEEEATMDVLVLGGLGGRVDQGFSQIHHLYMAESDPSLLKGRIYLLSEQSLSFVLSGSDSGSGPAPSSNDVSMDSITARPTMNGHGEVGTLPNHNIIHVQPGYFAENVGILPILGLASITTRGFEWDVEDWQTQFGNQVSTSNHIRSDTVEISFQGPRPLFTMELEKWLRDDAD